MFTGVQPLRPEFGSGARPNERVSELTHLSPAQTKALNLASSLLRYGSCVAMIWPTVASRLCLLEVVAEAVTAAEVDPAADERSRAITTKFNVAEGVEQTLGSVAEMTDVGNLVLFDQESGGSCVIPGRSPEAARIRKAAEQCKTATKIYRRKNTYYIPIWVQPEATAKVPDARMSQSTIVNKAPFQGQGR